MNKLFKNAAPTSGAAFFSFVNHPFKFRLYLLKNLPSAYFSGVRLVEANEHSSKVSVRYKWFTKNPFRSTYFASLSMAAELSTGLLAMANTLGNKPQVSLLITSLQAKFHKKAKGLTVFQCNEGVAIYKAVMAAIETGQAQEIKVYTLGKNEAGETIAEFWFTWSFKMK